MMIKNGENYKTKEISIKQPQGFDWQAISPSNGAMNLNFLFGTLWEMCQTITIIWILIFFGLRSWQAFGLFIFNGLIGTGLGGWGQRMIFVKNSINLISFGSPSNDFGRRVVNFPFSSCLSQK